MAEIGWRLGNFRPDSAGIVEIFTSGGMVSALHGVADPMAASLSAEARANLHHGGFEDEGSEPYQANVVDHDRTAVAFVGPRTEQGFTNEKLHHSLGARNH